MMIVSEDELEKYLGNDLESLEGRVSAGIVEKLGRYDTNTITKFGLPVIDYIFIAHQLGKSIGALSMEVDVSTSTLTNILDMYELPRLTHAEAVERLRHGRVTTSKHDVAIKIASHGTMMRDEHPNPGKTDEYTTPQINSNEYYAKRRGFESYVEYRRYFRLAQSYEKQLLNLPSLLNLNIGFDIREIGRLSKKGDSLVVRLVEEDTDFADGYIEKIFRYGIETSLSHINATANFEISSSGNTTVVIRPYDLESMAFLNAYRTILKRDLLR